MGMLQGLGILAGAMAVVLIGFSVSTLVWVKRSIKNRLYLYVLEVNNHITKHLVAIDDNGQAQLDGQTYDILPQTDFQFTTLWPSGMPGWLQEPVTSQLHIRNRSEPVNVRTGAVAVVSARSRSALSDEKMLESMWHDARKELGIITGAAGLKSWTTWLSIATLAITIALGLLIYMMWTEISSVSTLLGG